MFKFSAKIGERIRWTPPCHALSASGTGKTNRVPQVRFLLPRWLPLLLSASPPTFLLRLLLHGACLLVQELRRNMFQNSEK